MTPVSRPRRPRAKGAFPADRSTRASARRRPRQVFAIALVACLATSPSFGETAGAPPADGARTGGAAAPAPATRNKRFSYNRSPQKLLLRFSDQPGELDASLSGPELEIYGGGRVVVRYPAYMKQAGEHHLTLTASELDGLMDEVVRRRLVEFDESAVRLRRRGRARHTPPSGTPASGPPRLFHSSDASLLSLEFNLEEYAGQEPGAPLQRDLHKKIRYRGLRHDAQRNPEIEELQNLEQVSEQLRQLMRRRDLVKSER